MFRIGLEKEFKAAGSKWVKLLPYLWSIGPINNRTNLIFNRIPQYCDSAMWHKVFRERKQASLLFKISKQRKNLKFNWGDAEKQRQADSNEENTGLGKKNVSFLF